MLWVPFPLSLADNFDLGRDPDPRLGMVEVLASETRLDGPASLWNSSNGEVEKPKVESPRRSLVARDGRVNDIINPYLGPSSVVFELLRGDGRAWVGNWYLVFHSPTG